MTLADGYKNKVADISIGLVAEMAQIEIKPFQNVLTVAWYFLLPLMGLQQYSASFSRIDGSNMR